MASLAALIAGLPPQDGSARAIIAIDDAGQRAEDQGNSEYLEHLLLPSYVSVSADGSVTTRESLVRKAQERSPAQLADLRMMIGGRKAKHPTSAHVMIEGDTAILRWSLPGSSGPVSSADVFSYVKGEWRAACSQHTSASR